MKKRTAILAAIVASLILGGTVLSQSSAGFRLWWSLIAGGGGRAASSSYVVDGSIGQPQLGVSGSSSYGLQAGFWPGMAGPILPTATTTATVGPSPTATRTVTGHRLYLPVIMRSAWL